MESKAERVKAPNVYSPSFFPTQFIFVFLTFIIYIYWYGFK